MSTAGLAAAPSKPFCFLMDAALLGVGVGFDTKGAQEGFVVPGPAAVPPATPADPFRLPDTREGMVDSVRLLLDAYLVGGPEPTFDYSGLRPAGAPIAGFGGHAAGPEPMRRLHEQLAGVLKPLVGRPLTVTAIVDVMNLIGACVVAGGVRRTAEIAFGDPTPEYIGLKDYEANPGRAAWGWTSNNSVFAQVGMRYEEVCAAIRANGEPGLAWLDNMRAYGRMGDPPTHADARAAGGNPCLEQTLESYELCCLVETFPAAHGGDLTDFCRTLKFAYLYAKTVTLGVTHWPETNRVLLRNRRIGCSMSGLAQFLAAHSLHDLRTWCAAGYATIQTYDRVYSEWLGIPRSVKTTCVKPSGTVSLLAGATPGMHYPESRFYVRRVRLSGVGDRAAGTVAALRAAGYTVEPDAMCPDTGLVVEFPVDAGEGVRTSASVTMWEQLGLAALLQRHWADNQVSCTVTFDPDGEGPHLPVALAMFDTQLKGVSFLPRLPKGAYPQMPYEAVSAEVYEAIKGRLVAAAAPPPSPDGVAAALCFCDGDACALTL